jgi:hypothetical protein
LIWRKEQRSRFGERNKVVDLEKERLKEKGKEREVLRSVETEHIEK